MGATAMADIEQAQQKFIEMLPDVQRIAGHVFAALDSESREEAVAETVAMCWQNHLHCAGQGKEIGAPSLTHYATLGMRSGRTLCGQSSTDVLSPRTQILGRARIRSLDKLHETTTDGAETWGWWNCTEALIDKRVWERPPKRVRIKLD